MDEPTVLWERDGKLSAELVSQTGQYPPPDPQWIEDRLWTWVHYAAGKIGRGELFEAIEFLSFLRVNVLAPLGREERGLNNSGVRRLETLASEFAQTLAATVASHHVGSLLDALNACVSIYRRLRSSQLAKAEPQSLAEQAAMDYLLKIDRRFRPASQEG